jgi:hypothetical protein
MEYVFYLLVFAASVYVLTGVVQSTIFVARPIQRDQLPAVVEQEFDSLFPDFKPQSITYQKARHRYQLDGKYAGKTGQLSIGLTPESDLSTLEFVQTGSSFVKIGPVACVQVPLRVAARLKCFLADDQALMETSNAQSGLIDDQPAYRIHVNSRRYHYQFEITDAGELYKFTKREVA